MTTAPRVEAKVTVRNKQGLHARPSSVLAQAAIGFPDTAIRLKKGALEVVSSSRGPQRCVGALQSTALPTL